MAIRVTDEFGSRANPPDAAYPDGSLKNETTPGVSNDGSPLDSRVGNDWEGFKQSALAESGIAANGSPDSVDNPQILNAIKKSNANVFSNSNLLSNSNFLIPSPDAITHPNATPESYASGTQIFSGVYAGSGGCTVTFINGRVNCTTGDYQFKLANTNGLDRVPIFTSSVSDYDGTPKTTGVSHTLVADEYIVTVTPSAGDVFSVKLEQGSIPTRHDVTPLESKVKTLSFSSVSELVLYDVSNYNETIIAEVESYFYGSLLGGGRFYWQSTRSKLDHNGGTVIDPERPYPSSFEDETELNLWFQSAASGQGCWVKANHNRANYDEAKVVAFEEFGMLGGGVTNHIRMQALLNDSSIRSAEFQHAASFRETIEVKTPGMYINGNRNKSGYEGPSAIYLGPAATYGIHVKTYGTSIENLSLQTNGDNSRNGLLFHRSDVTTPDGADLDAYVGNCQFADCGVSAKAVGRNLYVHNSNFGGYTTGVEFEQFIWSEGIPDYHQTLERGFRRMRVTGCSFHASSGSSIRNSSTGRENLYDCLFNDNSHDTGGFFFSGALKESQVSNNEISRLSNNHSSNACAFLMDECIDVTFGNNRVQGETGDLSDATMPNYAFVFRSRTTSGVVINGGNFKNIRKTPVHHDDPPEGSVSIVGVTATNCANEVSILGASMPAMVDIQNATTSNAMDGYQVRDCVIQPYLPSTGVYTSILGVNDNTDSHRAVNVYGNTVTRGFVIPSDNLTKPSSQLFTSMTYSGDGSASRTLLSGTALEFVTITPVSSSSAVRFEPVTVIRGTTGAASDSVELVENTGDVIVHGDYNQSGVTYTLIGF